ncbi:unnamed protein product [Heligmosomoides polygyrus]|uniref:Glucuronosyltransferase n=1 Tax=Heligmosomoides polygyrus TaxID=6339 RepID=A0A183FVY0_HELPZ|nr:unnamed protein product [Heligmosomoides polygyrus]
MLRRQVAPSKPRTSSGPCLMRRPRKCRHKIWLLWQVTLMVTSEQRKTVTAVMVVLAMGHATPMLSVLDYADAHDLTIVNTKFRKRDSHLISFYSGNAKTQIDYVLVRRRDQGLVTATPMLSVLDYADAHDLTIVNTKFRKRDSHLISFYSGNAKTQIDYVLVRRRDRGLVTGLCHTIALR